MATPSSVPQPEPAGQALAGQMPAVRPGWHQLISKGGLTSIALNALLPLISYVVLKGQGVGEVAALSVAMVFPFIAVVGQWIRAGHPDPIGILSIVFIAFGLGAALATNNPIFVLLQGPGSSTVFALMCFGSLLLPRPLMFYISRQIATGGSREGMAGYDHLWSIPEFRHQQRVITIVWGAGLAASAVLGLGLMFVLEAGLFLAVWQVITHGGSIGLIAWTMAYNHKTAHAHPPPAVQPA